MLQTQRRSGHRSFFDEETFARKIPPERPSKRL